MDLQWGSRDKGSKGRTCSSLQSRECPCQVDNACVAPDKVLDCSSQCSGNISPALPAAAWHGCLWMLTDQQPSHRPAGPTEQVWVPGSPPLLCSSQVRSQQAGGDAASPHRGRSEVCAHLRGAQQGPQGQSAWWWQGAWGHYRGMGEECGDRGSPHQTAAVKGLWACLQAAQQSRMGMEDCSETQKAPRALAGGP